MEPQEKRAVTAQPIFQEYRILDVINNIEIKNFKTKLSLKLEKEQRKNLFEFINNEIDKYNSNYEMPYNEIYKKLNIDTTQEKFNIDTRRKDSDKGIKANQTKKIFKDNNLLEDFEKLDKKEQEIAIEFLSCVTDFSSILDNNTQYIYKFIKEDISKIIKEQTEENIKNVINFIEKFKIQLEGKNSTLTKLEKSRKTYSIKALKNIVKSLNNGENKEDIIN